LLHEECEKLDPRIRRTRQLLREALTGLLERKDFDSISIQEIAEAATLNRGTFYAHYTDKFALLEEWIRLSFLEHLEQRNLIFDGSCSSAFQAIFLALCDFLAEVQKLRSSQQRQFEPYVEAGVVGQLQKIFLDGFKKHPAERAVSEELTAAAASWAMYGAAKHWVNTPDRVPAEKFVGSAVSLVKPILAGPALGEAPSLVDAPAAVRGR
jgi:AcrR family transcriptional regulator